MTASRWRGINAALKILLSEETLQDNMEDEHNEWQREKHEEAKYLER